MVGVRSPSGSHREGQSGGGGWGGGEGALLSSPEPEQPWGILSSQESCGGDCEVSSVDTGLILLRGGQRPGPREVTGCHVQRGWAGEAGRPPSSPTQSWGDAETPARIRPPREEEREERLRNSRHGSTLTGQGTPGAGATCLFRGQRHTGVMAVALL